MKTFPLNTATPNTVKISLPWRNPMRMPKRAFTLIELLIVIAIILILISIALPNFLEAQVRAKVANVASELRSLEIAFTSYLVDHKRHMADGTEIGVLGLPGAQGISGEGDRRVYAQLTTPTQYVKNLPVDDFHTADRAVDQAGAGAGSRDPNNNVYRYYAGGWRCLASDTSQGTNKLQKNGNCSVGGSVRGRKIGYPFDPNAAFAGQWISLSPGPDRSHSYGEWAMFRVEMQNGNPRIYSPTNGTVSFGDLVRWGN